MPKTAKPKKHRGKLSLKKNFLFLCSCCVVVTVLALTSINLIPQKNVLGASTENTLPSQEDLLQEIAFWQDFVAKNPDYFDGWIELATLEYQLGDKKGAAQELEKARNIYPNSEKVRQLEALLGGK